MVMSIYQAKTDMPFPDRWEKMKPVVSSLLKQEGMGPYILVIIFFDW